MGTSPVRFTPPPYVRRQERHLKYSEMPDDTRERIDLYMKQRTAQHEEVARSLGRSLLKYLGYLLLLAVAVWLTF